MGLKQGARKALGETAWGVALRVYLAVRRGYVGALGALGRASLSALSTQDAVKVVEQVRFFAPLDYPVGQIRMRISTYGEYKRATRACSKEPGTVTWIESRFRPGDVFFDIGANVGAYSFVAHAHTRGQCRTYAFEPSFSTFSALCNNVFTNHCAGSIVPLQVALSDTTGLATFKYSNVEPGAAFHSVGDSADDVGPVKVVGWDEEALALRGLSGRSLEKGVVFDPVLAQPTITYRLDDAVSMLGLPVPSHIKIDVDGAEFKVIEGARMTMQSPQLRSLLVEIDLDSVNRINTLMTELGFIATDSFPCGIDYASIVFERRAGASDIS